jgi:hypothetical protein
MKEREGCFLEAKWRAHHVHAPCLPALDFSYVFHLHHKFNLRRACLSCSHRTDRVHILAGLCHDQPLAITAPTCRT